MKYSETRKLTAQTCVLFALLTLCGCSKVSDTTNSTATNTKTDVTSETKGGGTARDLFYQELKESSPAGSASSTSTGGNPSIAASGDGKIAAAVALEIKAPEWQGDSMLSTAPPRKEGFKGGDSIRFHVKAGVPCYAYVFTKGSSGKEALLYPPNAATDNKLDAGKEFVVPQNGKISFDNTPGKEAIIVVLSTSQMSTKSIEAPQADMIELNRLQSNQTVNCGNLSVFTGSTEPVRMVGSREIGDKYDPYFYVDNSKDPTKPCIFGIGLPHI